jgi:hypothetical protein
MPFQPIAEEDPTATAKPPVPPDVQYVEALPGYRLRVRFKDGLEGTVDMTAFVHSPRAGVFAALADPVRFGQVHVSLGVVTWTGELDLAPDAMYDGIKTHGHWTIS